MDFKTACVFIQELHCRHTCWICVCVCVCFRQTIIEGETSLFLNCFIFKSSKNALPDYRKSVVCVCWCVCVCVCACDGNSQNKWENNPSTLCCVYIRRNSPIVKQRKMYLCVNIVWCVEQRNIWSLEGAVDF